MRRRMIIGSRPKNETRSQNATRRRECQVYITLLRRSLGRPPPGATLKVIVEPNRGLSVACDFQESEIIASYYAYLCKVHAPKRWDEVARRQLSSFRPARLRPKSR